MNKNDPITRKTIEDKKRWLTRKNQRSLNAGFEHFTTIGEAERRFGPYQKDVAGLIEKTLELIPGSHITALNELIVIPAFNVYFRLEDVKDGFGFEKKVIAWVSKACTDDWSPSGEDFRDEAARETARDYCNAILGTQFGEKEFEMIYVLLGNGVNDGLCERFVRSFCDIGILRAECEKEGIRHA